MKELSKNAILALEKQGKLSKDPVSGICRYELKDGSCCIVGHMMPDSKTRKEADDFGESTVYALVEEEFSWISQFKALELQFMGNLQNIHDSEGIAFDVAVSKMKQAWENKFADKF